MLHINFLRQHFLCSPSLPVSQFTLPPTLILSSLITYIIKKAWQVFKWQETKLSLLSSSAHSLFLSIAQACTRAHTTRLLAPSTVHTIELQVSQQAINLKKKVVFYIYINRWYTPTDTDSYADGTDFFFKKTNKSIAVPCANSKFLTNLTFSFKMFITY